MRWDTFYKSFLVISLSFLASCSNLNQKITSTPQLPINEAGTILPSPDGKWVAYFFGLYGNYNEPYQGTEHKLSVANFDDTIVWNVSQENLNGGESWFIPYRWSKDSRYLYFNISFSFSGYAPFYQGAGLQRLDVLTGTVSEVISSGFSPDEHIYIWNLVSFTLSPDDKLLAYFTYFDDVNHLVIREMKTGNEKSLPLNEYEDAGSIVWSPQKDKLVFAAINGNTSDALSYIELVEVGSLTSRTLVKDRSWILEPIMWTDNHTILLKDRGGAYLFLDTITEELTPSPALIIVPN